MAYWDTAFSSAALAMTTGMYADVSTEQPTAPLSSPLCVSARSCRFVLFGPPALRPLH